MPEFAFRQSGGHRQADMLETIVALQNEALSGGSGRDLFERLLRTFLDMTGSAYGFIGEILHTDRGAPFLRTMAITDIAWNDATRRIVDAGLKNGMDFTQLDTLFGHTIRTGEQVLSNDPSCDPRSSGLPPGHPPLLSYLGLPLGTGDCAGLVGLANRPGGYDPEIVAWIRPLVVTAATLLRVRRAERMRADEGERRQAAETELRRQMERLDLVIAGTGVGIWDWNPQSGSVVVNARWAEIVGYGLEELEPVSIKTWTDLAHPDDLADSQARLEAVFSGRASLYECDARMRHKAGHWVWVRDTGRVVERDADGRPLRMVGTHLDVTDQKRTLEQAVSYRSQLEAILAAAPDGIMTVDRSLRITRFNPAAEQLFGWTAAEIIGQPLRVLLPPDQTATHDGLAAAFFDSDSMQPRQMAGWNPVNGCRKDGSTLPVLVTLSGTHLDGEPAIVAAVKDMTQIQAQQRDLEMLAARLEEQLRRAYEASEAKSRFLAALSHELRTPLNAIIGFSDLVAEDVDGAFGPEKRREYAGDVAKAGRHLLALIEDLLDLARIESDRVELRIGPLPPRDVVQDAGRLMDPIMQEKGIRFERVVAPDLPTVLADRRALHQILFNLLGNAAKFTPSGGQVVLSTTAADGSVRFVISDTGCGIPADQVPRLGEPFVQAGDHYNGSSSGLGLGLAISRGLVTRLGGEFAIDSAVGQGTRVSFTLPIASDDHSRAA